MPDYALTYFDFDGGRAEPARIALHSGSIPFEDRRLSFAEFGKMRHQTRFGCVPTLHIDGEQVGQSNAINRYVGKLVGLYPEGALQALYCDEAMDAVEDSTHYVVQTFALKGEALKTAREKLVQGWLGTYLKGLGELLERGGGRYFADGRLTMADLKVFMHTRSVKKGTLDHVPTDLVEQLAPGLAEHRDRIAEESIVRAYYAR